jgi:acetolactate synthase-1/2/3 large subunit
VAIMSTDSAQPDRIEGHGGHHALRVARDHGVETIFTLSGAHVFPIYDAAVTSDPQTRLLDVRHEQTAAFAAEATGKLTRTPGMAVLTAGPGVTNAVSALAQASFSGAPMVVIAPRTTAGARGLCRSSTTSLWSSPSLGMPRPLTPRGRSR